MALQLMARFRRAVGPSGRPASTRSLRNGAVRAGMVLALSVGLVVTGAAIAPSPAHADQYPTWADVQAAKANQAAAQAEVTQVTALLKNLQTESQQAQAAAVTAGQKLADAQDALFAADQTYQTLKTQADQLTAAADSASTRAGRVAAQLYRSGGHNITASLLFQLNRSEESNAARSRKKPDPPRL